MAMGKIYMASRSKGQARVKRRLARRARRTYRNIPPRIGQGSGGGIPPTMLFKFKYVHTLNFNDQTIISAIFRGNDLQQPLDTGATHQPYSVDQFATFYNRFTVYASKIKVIGATDGAKNLKLVVRPTNSNTPISNYSLSVERPYSKQSIIVPGGKHATVKHYMKTSVISGTRDIGDEEWAGLLQAGGPLSPPDNRWYWAIAGDAFDDGTIANCSIQVEIIYYTKFWQRVNQAQS